VLFGGESGEANSQKNKDKNNPNFWKEQGQKETGHEGLEDVSTGKTVAVSVIFVDKAEESVIEIGGSFY